MPLKYRKPPGLLRLDRSNTVLDRIAFAFGFNHVGDWRNLATESPMLPGSNAKVFRPTAVGMAAQITSTSTSYDTGDAASFVNPFTNATGDITLVVLANPTSSAAAAQQVSISRWGGSYSQSQMSSNMNSTLSGTTAGQFTFGFYSGGYGGVVTHASSIDGDWHLWVGTRRGTDHRLYRDGVEVGSATATAVAFYESGSQIGVGQRPNGADDYVASNDIAFAAGWARALSAAEVAKLSNLASIFRTPIIPHFKAGSAAASQGELSKSIGDITIASTGSVSLNGSLNNSIGDVTLSAAGVLDITGALTQSIGDVSLNAAGSLAVNGSLSQSIGDVTLEAAGVVAPASEGELSKSIGDIVLGASGIIGPVQSDATGGWSIPRRPKASKKAAIAAKNLHRAKLLMLSTPFH